MEESILIPGFLPRVKYIDAKKNPATSSEKLNGLSDFWEKIRDAICGLKEYRIKSIMVEFINRELWLIKHETC